MGPLALSYVFCTAIPWSGSFGPAIYALHHQHGRFLAVASNVFGPCSPGSHCDRIPTPAARRGRVGTMTPLASFSYRLPFGCLGSCHLLRCSPRGHGPATTWCGSAARRVVLQTAFVAAVGDGRPTTQQGSGNGTCVIYRAWRLHGDPGDLRWCRADLPVDRHVFPNWLNDAARRAVGRGGAPPR